MINNIRLVWAKKFKELTDDVLKSNEEIIAEYLEYCNKEEKEINERWENDKRH